MSVVNAIPLIAAGDDGYSISRSLRFRSSASAYLSRTPATTSNRKTWTWSGWIKWSVSDNGAFNQGIFGASSSSLSGVLIAQSPNTPYQMSVYNCGYQITTTQVFRDPAAWYHIVVVIDTTQATASNRTKLYVNGLQVTSFSSASYPAQNSDTDINTASISNIFGNQPGQSRFFDGYMTEINFIDGQALTPSSFGETDAVTGVWKPKKYAGTYGTNGFYLNFSDNSAATAAAIGKDYSGNSNNWTPNNISVTAGVTYDSMIDVPTMWADGGNGRGNYAVINPLDFSGTAGTVSDGNLALANSSSGARRATLGITGQKIYWEIMQVSTVNGANPIAYGAFGLTGAVSQVNTAQSALAYTDNGSNKGFWRTTTAGIVQTVTPTSFTMSPSDVLQIAYDGATGNLWFGKNGTTWYDGSGGTTGNPSTGANPVFTLPDLTNPMAPGFSHAGVAYSARLNCGQRPFAYTPPTGFKALNTQNLPEPTIKRGDDYFGIVTRAGTGASAAISSYRFAPDFVWIKARTNAYYHKLLDKVRGANKVLASNATDAELTETQGLMSFDANGYTLGTSSDSTVNNAGSGQTYVDWAWKESPSAGFDIVTGTAPASGVFTVNHSLGVAPAMIIIKDRTSAASWPVYHRSLSSPQSNFLQLNTTIAATSSTTMWNNTAPTSTSFQSQAGATVNPSSAYVAYLFAEVAGFSRFGSYTGNGSADGPFVYLGFRPRFVMVKLTSGADRWGIVNSASSPYNEILLELHANNADAEGGAGQIDFTSTGFKMRSNNSVFNSSGGTYIYMAFAENPFKYANAR